MRSSKTDYSRTNTSKQTIRYLCLLILPPSLSPSPYVTIKNMFELFISSSKIVKLIVFCCAQGKLYLSNIHTKDNEKVRIIPINVRIKRGKDKAGGINYRNIIHNTIAIVKFQLLVSLLIVYIYLRTRILREKSLMPVISIFVGAYDHLMPLLISRFLKMRTLILNWGSTLQLHGVKKVYIPIARIHYLFSDIIALQCPEQLKDLGLKKLNSQVIVWGIKPINTRIFKCIRPIHLRKYDVAYIGRLEPEKGILEFLRAVIKLLYDNPRLRILIVGEGYYSPLLKRLQQIVRNNIIYLPWLEQRQLASTLNDVKILVLPSQSEGLPSIITEALACGVIVIATSVGCLRRVILHGRNGYLISLRPRNKMINELINILKYILSLDIEILQDMSQYAYKSVSMYSEKYIKRTHIAILERKILG